KLASVFYTNKYHISHLFKQNMHISYYQYVIQMRLITGKNSILDGVPVAKVWETCGFSDHAGLYRAFRKWYGVSPNRFNILHAEQLKRSDGSLYPCRARPIFPPDVLEPAAAHRNGTNGCKGRRNPVRIPFGDHLL